jgi:arylsulfatase A-like enzyme
LLALLLGLGAGGMATACGSRPAPPNVLLITVDTLRADRLGPSSGSRAATPHLERLASQGLRFDHALTPRAKTTPAIASLMTGLYPHDHGARELMVPLGPGPQLLAERLRANGWRTAAIVGNYVLKGQFSGLQRGFDTWIEDLPQSFGVPPENVPQRTASSLTQGALAALGLGPAAPDGAGPREACLSAAEPWFLWLHYMDPHGSYDPPPEHLLSAGEPDWIPADLSALGDAIHRPWVAEYNVPASARVADGRIDAAAVRALYDGEVSYVDAEIGRLIEALERAGLWERTLVVFCSDHGESLGEQHYWFEHGRNVSESSCRVPLVLRLPESLAQRELGGRRARAGQRIPHSVSLVDLAPTLTDLLGLEALDAAQEARPRGRSLREHLAGGNPAPRAVFYEKIDRADASGAIQAKAVTFAGWKFVRRYAHDGDAGDPARKLVTLSEELYELAGDPWETRNQAGDPPPRAPLARLAAELLRFSEADVRFADLAELLKSQRQALERADPESLRILRSLGY